MEKYEYNYLRNDDYEKEYEQFSTPKERFIIKVNSFKQSAGLWYSLAAQKIVPFLLFIIPVNVFLGHTFEFVMSRFSLNWSLLGTPLLVSWVLCMLGLLVTAIFLPKVATVFEFTVGICYIYLAFKYSLFNNIVSMSLFLCLVLFLLVKFVFLIFKLISYTVFSKDDENVERDESGRIIRNMEDNVYFTKEADDQPETVVEDDIYFTEEADDEPETAVSDDVYFTEENDEESETLSSADEVYFTEENEEPETRVVEDEVYFAEENNEPETRVVEDDVYFIQDDKNMQIDDSELEMKPDEDFFFG